MAGKRQHYLPQFLQRGFASDIDGKRTWLFRQDSAPKEVGMRDVGVEEQFYSDFGDRTLDEAITKLETYDLSTLIQRIRAGNPGPVSCGDFSKLIAHLEVRSRHLRASVAELSEALWRMTAMQLQAPGLLAQIFQKRYQREPAALVEPAREQLGSMGLPVVLAESVADTAMRALSTGNDEFFAMFWAAVMPVLDKTLRPRLLEVAKRAHLNALTRSISPEVRAEQYRKLAFDAADIASSDLLLGDSAVLFHVEGPRAFKPFLDKDDSVIAVLLPLSPRRILVGSNVNYVVKSEIIRGEIARCSHKFFIASQYSQAGADLAQSIGASALPLTNEDLGDIVRQAIAEQLS